MSSECPNCGKEIPETSRYCGQCGSPVLQSSTLSKTMTIAASTASARSPSQGRFAPGEVIAGRYQVIDLLGTGGMGEVYRANDLTLQQPVALKFLPTHVAEAPPSLARFRNEVRLARQVSHPNVCRVYDIGTAGGQTFLSMEYVDGEDLASLLRRIGRVPPDKGVDIARGLCQGLAAAHQRGVLHRDLKPANVMIDSRGKVIVMDFGLAAMAGEITQAETRQGTLQYMAPEQLAGKEVTTKSDVYALGLVLYEIFTGKRAFESKSAAELLRLEESSSPTRPSSLVKDLEPGIERVILRCLASDPAKRPASVLAVLAGLPGGDPLEAAIAAGETPSPEAVAAAGPETAFSVSAAAICAALAIAGVIVYAFLTGKISLFARIPFEQPPEVLRAKANELLVSLGYSERPGDYNFGFAYDASFTRLQDASRAARLFVPGQRQHPPVWFWYRQSPRKLLPTEFDRSLVNKSLPPGVIPGAVSEDDPPETEPGMISLVLDTTGRLCALRAIPSAGEAVPAPATRLDWTRAFAAAGLDPAEFSETSISEAPPVIFDAATAWSRMSAQDGSKPLIVRAAAWRGRIVYFSVGEFWRTRTDMAPAPNTGFLVLLLALLIVPIPIARLNLRAGRGDLRGALRLAAFSFSTSLLAWIFGGTHVADAAEVKNLIVACSITMYFSLVQATVYVALEPYVRRRWPRVLIGWSRLLAGNISDPLTNGEILAGTTAGVLLTLHIAVLLRLAWPLADTEVAPAALLGLRHLVAELLIIAPDAVNKGLAIVFFVFLFRILLRNAWVAGAAMAAMLTVLFSAGSNAIVWEINAVLCAVVILLMLRVGLLSVIAALFTTYALRLFPATTDLSVWYAPNGVFGSLAVLALTLYSFRRAMAGRRLFGSDLL